MKQTGHNLLKSGMIFSGITFLSRILGFIRDMVTANLLGAASDIFIFAQRIPNLFRRMFAEGSFSQAFVPIIAKHHSDHDNEEMKRMLASAAGWLSLITLTISILGIVFSSYVTMALANGWYHDYLAGTSNKYQYASILLKVTFPYIFFVSLVALCGALYNVIGRVAVFSFTPCILNLAIIFSALVFPRYFGYDVNLSLCLGVFFGGVAQLAFQIPYLKKIGFLVMPRLELTPSIRKMFKNMVPALIGASGYQLNMLVNTIVASFLISGSLSWLYYAERLLELPLGIFGVAIATILLPTLSRKVKQYQDNPNETTKQNFTNAMNWGVTTSIIVAFPATICMITLGKHIIDLLFHHGQFNLDDLNNTYLALLAFSFSVAPSMLVKTFNNAFYAHENTKVPMRVSLFTIGCNIVLNLFALRYGFWFLALSTSFCVTLNALIVYFILRYRNVYRFNKDTWITIARVLVASIALAVTLLYLPASIRDYIQFGNITKILHLAFYGIVGGVVYLAVLFALGFRVRHVKYRETLPSLDPSSEQATPTTTADASETAAEATAVPSAPSAPTPTGSKKDKKNRKGKATNSVTAPTDPAAPVPTPSESESNEVTSTATADSTATKESAVAEVKAEVQVAPEATSTEATTTPVAEPVATVATPAVAESTTTAETEATPAKATQTEATSVSSAAATPDASTTASVATSETATSSKKKNKKSKKARKEAKEAKSQATATPDNSPLATTANPVAEQDAEVATATAASEAQVTAEASAETPAEVATNSSSAEDEVEVEAQATPATSEATESPAQTTDKETVAESAEAVASEAQAESAPASQAETTAQAPAEEATEVATTQATDSDAYNETKAKFSQEVHRNQLKTADSLADTSKVESTTTTTYSRGYGNGHEAYKQQTIKQESSVANEETATPAESPTTDTYGSVNQTTLYENKLQAQNAKQTTTLLDAPSSSAEQPVTKPQSYSAATLLAGKTTSNIVPPKPQRNVQIVSDSSLLAQSSSALDQPLDPASLATVPHDQGTLALNSERLISHPDHQATAAPGVRTKAHVEISFSREYTEADLIRMQEKHAQRLEHPEDAELNAIKHTQPTFRQTTTILPPAVLMGDQRNNVASQKRPQAQISVKSEVEPYLRKHPTIPTPVMDDQVVQNALAAQRNISYPFQQNLQQVTPLATNALNDHEVPATVTELSTSKSKSGKSFPPRLRNVGVVAQLNESKPIAAPVLTTTSIAQPQVTAPAPADEGDFEFDFGEWDNNDTSVANSTQFTDESDNTPKSAKEHYQQLSQQGSSSEVNTAPAPHDLYALIDDAELEKLRGQEPERYRLAKALLSTVKKTELVKALNPEEKDNPERILDAELWNLILGKKQSELQAIAEKQLSADDWDNAMRRELSLAPEAHVTTLNQALPEGATTGQTKFDKSKFQGSSRTRN